MPYPFVISLPHRASHGRRWRALRAFVLLTSALSCTNDALDATAKKRWARLGGGVPLGIVEAVAWGIASGELAWGAGDGQRARPRARTSGRGKVRTAAA